MKLVSLRCQYVDEVPNDENSVMVLNDFKALINVENIDYITDVSEKVVNSTETYYQITMTSNTILVVKSSQLIKIKRVIG